MPPNKQNELEARKKALDEKLRKSQFQNQAHQNQVQGQGADSPSKPPETHLGLAFRLVADFVVFILVGAAMGYGLDIWLKTSPWGLILFANLGFIGAIRNIIKKN